MNKTLSMIAALLLLPFAAWAHVTAEYADTVRFRFATEAEGRQLMGADDVYTRGWSEFDIVSRLKNPKGTRAELLAYKQAEVRAWTPEEQQTILRDMYAINQLVRTQGYRLPLPHEVVLVKTTMKDEGDAAGYTQANWIALTDQICTRMKPEARRDLLLHELSHVLTRNSLEYKERLYAALGFTLVRGGLEYPAELLKTRISNPDIGAYDSYGPFTIKGRTENCAMYLYADRPYTGGRFFEYVKVAFVPYDTQLRPKCDANGKVLVYGMEDVEDFFERVGKNTNYIIHPEEILAENFVLAFLQTPGVPTPQLQQRVYKVLKGE